MEREKIYGGVRDVLVDALGVDEDEINEGAFLTDDLGAESIDFLDIAFKLERRFGIERVREDFSFQPIAERSSYLVDELDTNRRLNESGVTALRNNYPHVDWSRLGKEPLLSDVPRQLTVKSLVDYVDSKLKTDEVERR